jgi:hypothetical protein
MESKVFGGDKIDMSTYEIHTEDLSYKGVSIKDISLKNMIEFRLMEDLDEVHIQPWGESVKPQSHFKLVYVHTQLMQFANSNENQLGYSQFVIPEAFAEDLEASRVHYITFTKNGEETGNKYLITKVD